MCVSSFAPTIVRPVPTVAAASARALASAACFALLTVSTAAAQSIVPAPHVEMQQVRVNRANWTLADRFSIANMRNLAFSTSVTPRWIGETDSMFYNWRDKRGGRASSSWCPQRAPSAPCSTM